MPFKVGEGITEIKDEVLVSYLRDMGYKVEKEQEEIKANIVARA